MRLDLISARPVLDTYTAPHSREMEAAPISFGETLKNAIYQVNNLQKESENLSQMLVKGEVDNLHDVVIAAEKARLSLDLTVTISNKLVQGYQELSRMQL